MNSKITKLNHLADALAKTKTGNSDFLRSIAEEIRGVAVELENTMSPRRYKDGIFISGPMTGYPEYNYPRFDQFANEFRRLGFDVVNPADIGRTYGPEKVANSPRLYARMTKEILDEEQKCNIIFLLHGWERSTGVRAELQNAIANNFRILCEDNFSYDMLAGKRDKFKIDECAKCSDGDIYPDWCPFFGEGGCAL